MDGMKKPQVRPRRGSAHKVTTMKKREERVTQLELAQIQQLQSQKQIAAKYKLHISTVNKMFCAEKKKRRNASLAVPGQEPAVKLDGRRRGRFGHLLPQMQALRAEGFSYRIIAQKLGIGDGKAG